MFTAQLFTRAGVVLVLMGDWKVSCSNDLSLGSTLWDTARLETLVFVSEVPRSSSWV